MLVDSLATAPGVHLLRRHSKSSPAPASLPTSRGALDARCLRRVREFIDSRLGEDLTIEMLADEARLSPLHFARAVKSAIGIPPHRYLTERRGEKARALIAEDRLPLVEIAESCGISSQSYFTRWFKRFVGTTPEANQAGHR